MKVLNQSARLNQGGLIDRNKPIEFQFDGKSYQGYQGDTLASALLANGVHLVGRSMKLHRPRGVFSAGAEECNALVHIGEGGQGEPNVRATLQPVYKGLTALSQNNWPSLRFDIHAILDWTSGLWPAGFYNKTFIWPSWRWYEGAVRNVAGLGRLPNGDDPDHYTQQSIHCDVLVCGGGRAGLQAAIDAAKSAKKVIVVEQDGELGGSALWDGSDITALMQALNESPNVKVLCNATAVAYFDQHLVTVSERLTKSCVKDAVLEYSGPRERLWKIQAKHITLATGAIEQPVVFPNNDRPGIMLASAVRQYLNRYAVLVGQKIVLVTNNDSIYSLANELRTAGAVVPCIIDSRKKGKSSAAMVAEQQGFTVHYQAVPANTEGRLRIKRLSVQSLNGQLIDSFVECDAVAMSGAWQPAVHLFSQARGKLRYDESTAAFVPDRLPENLSLIGDALGFAYGQSTEKNPVCRHIPNIQAGKQWIDFQHDVTLKDIDIAVQEEFVSVEHLKRYTTTGMSVDQGKTSNVNALTALAERLQKPISEVGTTTFRPFYMPVTLGSLTAGRNGERYALTRTSPIYNQLKKAGAEIWDYGHWRRPAAFPHANESLEKAMQREALAVRESVGIYDGSPLGKIEVRGPDAAEFLNRFYINNILTLKVGKARYGIMLNEKGIVIDDGIVCCLDEGYYLVHTTSGNADTIYAWMEEWQQCEWPDLDVVICAVTTQWANCTLQGPNARKVLAKLDTTIDLDNERFPHMSIQSGFVNGDIPIRVMRASFTGELGYEINIPANYGDALWQNLMAVGAEFAITPYGVESLMILRTEKGYLHIGADTDGTTVPEDIGWGGPIKNKKADFIGRRSLTLQENIKSDRFHYVGIECPSLSQSDLLQSGAHIIGADEKAPAKSQGYLTSAFYSPNVDQWVGLGLVKGGRDRIGETVGLFHNGSVQAAKIVEPLFFDKKGGRLHV